MVLFNNVFSLYGKIGVIILVIGVDICIVYFSCGIQLVLIFFDDCNWLINLFVQVLGSNKYKIMGDFILVVNDVVVIILIMMCDNLFQLVCVSWNFIILDQKDIDLFVFDLVGLIDCNWMVWVLNLIFFGWFFLYLFVVFFGVFLGDGMVLEFSSKYSLYVYLYVVFGVSRRGIVQMIFVFSGEIVVCKIVVI